MTSILLSYLNTRFLLEDIIIFLDEGICFVSARLDNACIAWFVPTTYMSRHFVSPTYLLLNYTVAIRLIQLPNFPEKFIDKLHALFAKVRLTVHPTEPKTMKGRNK